MCMYMRDGKKFHGQNMLVMLRGFLVTVAKQPCGTPYLYRETFEAALWWVSPPRHTRSPPLKSYIVLSSECLNVGRRTYVVYATHVSQHSNATMWSSQSADFVT